MAFQELKERQAFVWGNAPFEEVAVSLADVHDGIVAAVGPAGGKRWLEVACGTGELSQRAARAGADVVGVDFAPALIETAKRQATEAGLNIEFGVGDAENLEFEDASFDVVTSTFGAMFAPDQAAAAGELGRVTKPGGTIAMANWTPDGGVGSMFRLFATFQPPPPEGAGAPLDWGRPERVEELLGGAFDLSIEERASTLEAESAKAYWDEFSPGFGPLKTLLENSDDARRQEIHDAFTEYLEENFGTSAGGIAHKREYLLVRGTRR
jgi:ubiquinone/menaquinone biosynthesis C-methylase UbiE